MIGQARKSENMAIWSKRGNAIFCWFHKVGQFLTESTRKAGIIAVKS